MAVQAGQCQKVASYTFDVTSNKQKRDTHGEKES